MLTTVLGMILTVCLLAANTRAEQFARTARGDEPATKAAPDESVRPKEAQSSDPSNAPTGKPTQAQSKEEKRVREIKNRIRQYGRAARITVVLWNDNERYGSIEQIDADSFQLAEVDLNQEVRIEYKDVKKVRRGYGQFNGITGKRVNPKVDLIAKIVALALLIFVVPLAVPRT
jgi:hypothetical protein